MLLLQKQGGWNISRKSGEWSPDGWDLQENLIQSHALDMADDFFTLWVGEDEQDPTKNIIQVNSIQQTFYKITKHQGPYSCGNSIYGSFRLVEMAQVYDCFMFFVMNYTVLFFLTLVLLKPYIYGFKKFQK